MAPSRMGAVAFVVLANASAAYTNREEMPVILRVEPALVVDREGRISGTDSEIGKELEHGCCEDAAVTLIEHIDIAVFALDVNVACAVDGGRVDAPLEAVRVQAIVHTRHRSICIPVTVAGLSALELPFRHQVRVDLGDIERSSGDPGEGADDLAYRKIRVRAAVETEFLVLVVVLHHDGVRAVVPEHCLGVVPTKIVGGQHATV